MTTILIILILIAVAEARRGARSGFLDVLKRKKWGNKDKLHSLLAYTSNHAAANPTNPAIDSVSWEGGFNSLPRAIPSEIGVEINAVDPLEEARTRIYEQWVVHGTVMLFIVLLGTVFRDHVLNLIDYARSSVGTSIVSDFFLSIYAITFLEPLVTMFTGKHSKILREVEMLSLDILVAVYHVLFPQGSFLAFGIEAIMLTAIFSYLRTNYRYHPQTVRYTQLVATGGVAASILVSTFGKGSNFMASPNTLLGFMSVLLLSLITMFMHELVRGVSAFSETVDYPVPHTKYKKVERVESYLEPFVGLLHLVLTALISKYYT